MTNHKHFNEYADLFLKRMHETFPYERKITIYKTKFDMLSTIDSKKPVELFMESMIPYSEQILLKDEMFFKQHHFVNKAESISEKIGLINYWDNLEQITKNTIWEYIQGLFILGMGVMNKHEELKELINKTGFSAN